MALAQLRNSKALLIHAIYNQMPERISFTAKWWAFQVTSTNPQISTSLGDYNIEFPYQLENLGARTVSRPSFSCTAVGPEGNQYSGYASGSTAIQGHATINSNISFYVSESQFKAGPYVFKCQINFGVIGVPQNKEIKFKKIQK